MSVYLKACLKRAQALLQIITIYLESVFTCGKKNVKKCIRSVQELRKKVLLPWSF